jgi:DNA polymerase-4
MIVHVDMDAFYVSCEERDDPALRGRPAVVGGNPKGRGVVAAANYAARQYGIHSAMPAAHAQRLCPHLIFLPRRHDRYVHISRQMRTILERYTPIIEPLSLDEAFLDVTASERLYGPAAEIGRRIKAEIKKELDLTASVGVAANKFVAKVASDVGKPDGFLVVEPGSEQLFLDPLPVSKLWGVGQVANATLARMGVHTIAQIRCRTPEEMRALFGKWGEQMWRLARGMDRRPVVPDHRTKSISHETTFDEDIFDPEILRTWLLELTEQVAGRLRRNRIRGCCVQIKMRFSDFKTVTRAHTLEEPTDITQRLWHAAAGMLASNLSKRRGGIRLLGVGVTGLIFDNPVQAEMFEDTTHAKQRCVDAVSDQVRTRFGDDALRRGSSVELVR